MTEAGIPAWDDGKWSSLPSLSNRVRADVCVVGLGGSGLSAVQALLDLGKTVVGIDAGIVGGGAAGRNGGFLLAGTSAFYHDSVKTLCRDRARLIYQLTLQEIERIATDMPGVVRRTGSLRLAASRDEEDDCREHLSALVQDGFPAEEYRGREGHGLLVSEDASFQPLARCRLLAAKSASRGARLFEHSPASEIGDGVVRTAGGGTITCERVIVAVDGKLEVLLPELAPRVRTARLQMLASAPAPEVEIPRPVYSRYGFDYWQQLPDKRVVVGGCRDRLVEKEWTIEQKITPDIQNGLETLLRKKIGVTQPVTNRWAALVSFTDSELPIFEEVRPNVIAIGAYSGTGNVVGALYGRMAAEIAARGHSLTAREIGAFTARGETAHPLERRSRVA